MEHNSISSSINLQLVLNCNKNHLSPPILLLSLQTCQGQLLPTAPFLGSQTLTSSVFLSQIHFHHFSERAPTVLRAQLFATPWNAAHQAPLSVGFSRQKRGVGCHFLLQGIFPTQRLNLGLLHYRQIPYSLSHQGMQVNSMPNLATNKNQAYLELTCQN